MYSVDQDEQMMGIIEAIANEPIDDTPYSIVKNPKPVVESVMVFDDAKVDFSKWTSGSGTIVSSKKVGKAKTAPEKKVAQVTENDSTKFTKTDGLVVATDTKSGTEAKDAPKVGNGGSFDTVAKSAESAQKSGANDNKKFEENAVRQRKLCDMFRNHVKSLVTDERSAKDCDAILKKFDQITKNAKSPLNEAVVKSCGKVPSSAMKAIVDYIASVNDESDPDMICDIYSACSEDGIFDESKIADAYQAYMNGVQTDADLQFKSCLEASVETPNAEKDSEDDSMSAVTISYGNGRTISLSSGTWTHVNHMPEIVRTIENVEGSQTLANLKGTECVILGELAEGNPFGMIVNVNDEWKRWNSNAPVVKVERANA